MEFFRVNAALPAIISSVSALLGVAMGGFLTARVQKRQWARGQQIEACAAIVVESTRVQRVRPLSPTGWPHMPPITRTG